MKKHISLLLCVFLLVVSALTGCSKPAQEAPAAEATPATTEATAPVPTSKTEWAAAPNGKILVSPEWVNAVINKQPAMTYENSKYLILETSWGESSDAYKAGHLPGAIHFNTDNIETDPNFWNIGPVDHVTESLKANGITKDTTVIVYTDDVNSMAGARVVLALLWAGIDDVRLLDGGMTAWKAAGLTTETTENKAVAVTDIGVQVPAHPEYLIATPKEVLAEQKDPNFKLISIRSYKEFNGETSGYDYIKKAGEPKGAVWGHDVNGGKEEDGYLNPDGTFKSFKDVEAMWAEQGVTKDTRNAFYCGTGWRAAVPWLMAHMQGWDNTVLFDGGWHMWVMDDSLPVQVGDPNKK